MELDNSTSSSTSTTVVSSTTSTKKLKMNEKLEKLERFVHFVGDKTSVVLDFVGPSFERCYPYLQNAIYFFLPYKSEMGFFLGLVLLIFGGNFILTFAAFEAFRMYGFQQSKAHVTKLLDAINIAQVKVEKDEEETESNDCSDKSESKSPEQTTTYNMTTTQKIQRILKSVNPQQVSSSVVGLVSGFFSVIATLRVDLAKAITVGSSVADSLFGLLENFVKSIMEPVVPPHLQKWVLPTVTYVVKVIGILVAYFFARLVMTFAICAKGSELMVQGILSGAARTGKTVPHRTLFVITQISFGISILGLIKQYGVGSSLPGIVWVMLFPIASFEWFLATFVVGKM